MRYTIIKKRKVSIMSQKYTPDFKKTIIRLRLEEGRTMKSITSEYGVSKATISKWCNEFSEECHNKAESNPAATDEAEIMKENARPTSQGIRRDEKGKSLLKKAAAFFAKEID